MAEPGGDHMHRDASQPRIVRAGPSSGAPHPVARDNAASLSAVAGCWGAVISGKGDRNEAPLAPELVPRLREGMLLLAHRAYDAAGLLAAVAATGAQFLVRGRASRKPAVLDFLPDGSCQSEIDGLEVRIIEADLDVTGADGTRIWDHYRLLTTLTDWRRCPAGAEQELRALLTVCRAIRMAMTAAAESVPGTDPDRASRQPRLDTRRDKITQIMTSEPGRDWSGRGLAGRLGVSLQVMLTQLAQWTRLGLLAKTSPGRYTLPAAGSAGP